MTDSNVPSIEPPPLSLTDQQLQPYTNHIVEEQPCAVVSADQPPERVTFEINAEQHTVGMIAFHVEKTSNEHIAVTEMKGVAQKQQIELVKKTETSEGPIIERWVKTRIQSMVNIAIWEIEHPKYPPMIEGDTPVYSPSPFEKCLNCCCSAYSCKWLSSPFKNRQQKQQDKQEEEKDLIPKTESIRRAQTLGVKYIVVSVHNIFTSTPFGSTVREVAVYGGFLWALLFFLISLSGFIKDQVNENDHDDDFFGLFETIFGTIGIGFSIFDLFYHAYHRRFKTCKEWKQWREKKKNVNPVGEEVDTADNEVKESAEEPDSADCCKDKCKCCPKPCSTAFDVARVFVMEMLYYPGLILSIFQFATELVVNDNDPRMISVTTWLLNIIGFVGQLGFVYLARAFILAGTVYSVAKIRNKKNLLEGATFQVMFVLYTYGLMILQICMIVAIGATYYNEYYKLYQEVTTIPSNDHDSSGNFPTITPITTSTIAPTITPIVFPNGTSTNTLTVSPIVTPTITPTVTLAIAPTITPTVSLNVTPTITPTVSLNVTSTITPTVSSIVTPTNTPTITPVIDINYRLSGELWFMICCAFMTPIFGVIMFFVVHHFWTQKFPINVILDFLKVLKEPTIIDTLTSWKEEKSEDIRKVVDYLNEEQLQEDVKKIPSGRNRFCDKLTYPFKSPLHIILCLLYAIMLLTFFICCIVKGPGGGWILFYFLAFIFGFIVNWYACSVAIVWIMIFIGTLIVIAYVLLILILFCCCYINAPSNQNYRR